MSRKAKELSLLRISAHLSPLRPPPKAKATPKRVPTDPLGFYVEEVKDEEVLQTRNSLRFMEVYRFSRIFARYFGFQKISIEEFEKALAEKKNVVLLDFICKFLRNFTGEENITFTNWEDEFCRLVKPFMPDLASVLSSRPFHTFSAQEKIDLLYRFMLFYTDPMLEGIQAYLDSADPDYLRISPLGKDSLGNLYWNFDDGRIYRESAEVFGDEQEGKKDDEEEVEEEMENGTSTKAEKKEEEQAPVEVQVKKQKLSPSRKGSRRSSSRQELVACGEIAPGDGPKTEDLTIEQQDISSSKPQGENLSSSDDLQPMSDDPLGCSTSNETKEASKCSASEEKDPAPAGQLPVELEGGDKINENATLPANSSSSNEVTSDGTNPPPRPPSPPIMPFVFPPAPKWSTFVLNANQWEQFMTNLQNSPFPIERELHGLYNESIAPGMIKKLRSKEKDEERKQIFDAMPRKRSGRIQSLEIQKEEKDREERIRAENRQRELTLQMEAARLAQNERKRRLQEEEEEKRRLQREENERLKQQLKEEHEHRMQLVREASAKLPSNSPMGSDSPAPSMERSRVDQRRMMAYAACLPVELAASNLNFLLRSYVKSKKKRKTKVAGDGEGEGEVEGDGEGALLDDDNDEDDSDEAEDDMDSMSNATPQRQPTLPSASHTPHGSVVDPHEAPTPLREDEEAPMDDNPISAFARSKKFLFSSALANAATKAVQQQEIKSIIHYHKAVRRVVKTVNRAIKSRSYRPSTLHLMRPGLSLISRSPATSNMRAVQLGSPVVEPHTGTIAASPLSRKITQPQFSDTVDIDTSTHLLSELPPDTHVEEEASHPQLVSVPTLVEEDGDVPERTLAAITN